MITTANRIFVNLEYADRFEETFRTRAGLVDTMPGFIANRLLRPVNPDDPYIVLTFWETRAHFEAWVRSDEFVKGHARSGTLPKEAFTGPNKLELHEVILDSSQPDLVPEPRGKPFRVHGEE
jgi:heme-degrading monooxygenase HmoA